MCVDAASPTAFTDALTLQGFADDVFEGAYNITTDAQQGLGIFDGLSQILNVDVNVSGMNSNIQVSSNPVHCYCTWCVSSPQSVFSGWCDTGKQKHLHATQSFVVFLWIP